MSAAELNALDREVELTRARFANDLARLRSPHNIADFKEDLWARARDTRDGLLADLKARAAANPLAVAALAAGVAWRLFQRPPLQRCSSAWGWSDYCAPRPRHRTMPTPKTSSIRAGGPGAPAPWRIPRNEKPKNGARRRARLHATPRHRLRRPPPRWRSAPPVRCAMPATRRGRG